MPKMTYPLRCLYPALALTVGLLTILAGPAAAQTPLLEVEDDAGETLFRVDDHGGLLAPLVADDVAVVIPVEGPGTRLMWHPTQAAFRAGFVDGTQWDAGDIGVGSVAMGRNTIASGEYAFAAGSETEASGTKAVAMGENATAGGHASFAMGIFATASGAQAVAVGFGVEASGASSVALGRFLEASGETATALGIGTVARADHSTTMGQGTAAEAFASVALGRWNVVAGDQEDPVDTDPLLVAGNGTSDGDRSNALTLLQNGDLTIAGTLTESSDIRLKTGIRPVTGALDGVRRLTPIRYRYRPGTGHPSDPQIGLSAQEVRAVFPELVSEDSEGYLSVAYTDLAAVLVGAVNEQQEAIDRLRAENDRLRAENAALRADDAALRGDDAALRGELVKVREELRAIRRLIESRHR